MGVEGWKTILQEMVNLIQSYQEAATPANLEKIKQYEISVKDQYSILKKKEELEGFLNFLNRDFGNEQKLYPLLMSILFSCTKAERFLQEVMKYLADGKVDVFYSIDIRHQLEVGVFVNSSVGQNYELRRKVHKKQLDQMEKELAMQYPYIPWEQRNENLVVVVTNQLLYDSHAPSRNVRDICSTLMDMGREVILIVAVEKDNIEYLKECWIKSTFFNYNPELNGNFLIAHHGHKIKGYQILIHRDNKQEAEEIISDIYHLRPQFIWYMGGTSIFADLLRKSTTVLSMPFTDGYSVSEAPILIEYMNSGSAEVKKMESYLAKENQKHIHIYFEQIIRPSEKKYSRVDFNIPEDGFIITIVGVRLKDEVTPEFTKVVNKFLDIDPKIYIVFIGNMDQRDCLDLNRVSYLDFQQDLIGVLSLMDLFVNPPRKGGGTGAYWSLFSSVPVVTLGNCDVANCVNDDFICSSEDEMVQMVERHFKDKEYHELMRMKAKDIINEIEKKNNLQVNISKLIESVKEIEKDKLQSIN